MRHLTLILSSAALALSTSLAQAAAGIVINEIHYNPDVATELVEYVELHNPTSNVVSVADWAFTSGISYKFPAGASISPGGYLVLTENTNAFRTKFGFSAYGQFAGKLSNDGDTLTLRNAAGQMEDQVDYQLGFPWPTVGDSPGNSIELINPSLDNNLGGSWRSSALNVTAGSDLLISDGAEWKYVKGTAEASTPTTTWRSLAFDDSSWSTGLTPIGYDPTVLMRTPLNDMNGNYTSFFMRKRFVVSDVGAIANLTLEALYDDGFKVWINGTNVVNANISSGELAYNGVAGPARESSTFDLFSVGNFRNYLVTGTNIIAVQVHNSSLGGSSDSYVDLRLRVSTGKIGGSPGALNIVSATNAAPQIRQVDHSPRQPSTDDIVIITAKVSDPDGVANVTLEYQLVNPGSYIELTDAAYTNSWVSVTMNDAGTAGDLTAGDNLYTAQMPANLQLHRRLVRYRITATDSGGRTVRVPYADDPTPNFAYFVYNGVPAWTGAARPGQTPTITVSSNEMNRLPVYHLIARKATVETATWTSKYGGDQYQWIGTLVYDGKVYDHIHYRARGGVWRYAMGKNMWKFDMNRGHYFEARDNYGRKYQVPWNKVNLGANIQQGDYLHRGEQGMFESVGFRMFQLAGVDAPNTAFVQFRIVDEAAETSASSQYDGDFWGLYLAIENEDGRFLRQHNLPDGNLYKMENGTGPAGAAGEIKNQGSTSVSDYSDLITFRNTYLNTNPTDDWWRQNLNLEKYYSFQTIVQGIHHYDIADGKNYFFLRDPNTGLWSVEAWDLDLTWADNMYRAGVTGGDEPFKSRVLTRPAFNIEYQNRLREIQDLLYNSDEGFRLLNEFAAMIDNPDQQVTSIIDADRAQWDYNPVMVNSAIVNLSKAGQGRYYQQGATKDFPGMVQLMKNYINYRNQGVLGQLGSDSTIPATPTATYTGPQTFALNRVTFRASNYTGTRSFAGMEWRLARITPTNAPAYNPRKPRKYEIEADWKSGVLTSFDANITIPASQLTQGETYRVRVRMKDNSGRWSRWSAPQEFVAGASDSVSGLLANLRISELMYHAAAGSDFDFVELRNLSPTLPLNLAGAQFTEGIQYAFGPDAIIPPGGYLVLSRHPSVATFRAYYNLPAEVIVVGPYTGNLDNAGELLTLRSSAGGPIIASFEYSDGRSWPIAADGSGHSIVPVDVTADQTSGGLSVGANWGLSTYLRGSPGTGEPSMPATLLLNEFVANSAGEANDWIELFNPGTTELVLPHGWYLSDDLTNLTKWMMPVGTRVPARGFVSFDEQAHFYSTNGGFRLDRAGEQIFLSYLPLSGPGRVVDAIAFKGQEFGPSYGRFPDGANYWFTLSPTRDGTNAAPQPGVVISEIMYHPPDSNGTNDNLGDEFIEIHNASASAVTLMSAFGPWRLEGAIDYVFPSNTVLAANAHLLLVSFSPTNSAALAQFRMTYGLSPSVPVLGPYASKLPNSSGRVPLEKPIDGGAWNVVDEVYYGDRSPWPEAADGAGPSLQRVSSVAHGSDPSNWRAALASPGAAYVGGQPPVIDRQPEPLAAQLAAGGAVTYEVASQGSQPLQYQWRRDGRNLSGATNRTLVLNGLVQGDSGRYSVLVANAAGAVLSREVDLAVTVPPAISSHPLGQTVLSGASVTLDVTATGAGLLSYQWFYNGSPLTGATNRSLMFTDIQEGSTGNYQVRVTDLYGSAFSSNAVLTVLVAPQIDFAPQPQFGTVGGRARFSVAASGTRPLTYLWYRGITALTAETNPVLNLTNLQMSDAGNYRVLITNFAGRRFSSSVPLTVLADSDNDGIPDSWETEHGYDINNRADATLDDDNDGFTNYEEYIAGTNPRDASSHLRLFTGLPGAGASTNRVLRFEAVSNRTYTVEFRETFSGAGWTRLTNIDVRATSRSIVLTNPLPAAPRELYFRVVTPHLP